VVPGRLHHHLQLHGRVPQRHEHHTRAGAGVLQQMGLPVEPDQPPFEVAPPDVEGNHLQVHAGGARQGAQGTRIGGVRDHPGVVGVPAGVVEVVPLAPGEEEERHRPPGPHQPPTRIWMV